MNFGFPNRFLQKLEIYQQIRSGSGLAKYKALWRYEAAFLIWGYGKDHQFLAQGSSPQDFKENINRHVLLIDRKQAPLSDSSYDLSLITFIHENLIVKGLAEYTERDSVTQRPTEASRLRPTLLGLEVGEVLHEIYADGAFENTVNKYKYAFTIDLIWLLVIVGILRIFGIDDLVLLQIKETALNLGLKEHILANQPLVPILAVMVIWPLVSYILKVTINKIGKLF